MRQLQRLTTMLTIALWVVLIVGMVIMENQRGWGGDALWSLKAGQWMIAHHRILTWNIWSWTFWHQSWTNLEWGWDALLGVMWHIGGLRALQIWDLAWAGAGVLALLWVSRSVWPQASPFLRGLILFFPILMVLPGLSSRAQMASYVFWPVEWVLIRQTRSHRWLWACVIGIGVVWANMHGSFLLVGALIGADAIDRGVHGGWHAIRDSVLAGIAWLGLVTLLNPYHWHLWSYALWLSTNHGIATVIQEWQSPPWDQPFWEITGIGSWVLLMLGMWKYRAKIDLMTWLTWIGITLAWLHSQRILPYAAVPTIVLGSAIIQSMQEHYPTIHYPVFPVFRWTGWVAGCVAVGVAVVALHSPRAWIQQGNRNVPVATIQWIAHHPRETTRLWNPYDWGSNLIAAGVPDWIDTRADFFESHNSHWLIDDVSIQTDVSPLPTINPPSIWNPWHVRTVLVPTHSALNTWCQAEVQRGKMRLLHKGYLANVYRWLGT